MKLCINCTHYQTGSMGVATDKCMAPSIQHAPDLVRGEPRARYCELVRGDENLCGREAVLFAAALQRSAA